MKTYAEKLKDPRWQRKRLEIMQRDGFGCTFCGDEESTLNVHHHYYEKGMSPWEYPNEALTTLCEGCHRAVESMRLDVLKAMTWEVPLLSIHRLATKLDYNTLSAVANACAGTGADTIGAKSVRIKNARHLVKLLRSLIKDLEAETNEAIH